MGWNQIWFIWILRIWIPGIWIPRIWIKNSIKMRYKYEMFWKLAQGRLNRRWLMNRADSHIARTSFRLEGFITLSCLSFAIVLKPGPARYVFNFLFQTWASYFAVTSRLTYYLHSGISVKCSWMCQRVHTYRKSIMWQFLLNQPVNVGKLKKSHLNCLIHIRFKSKMFLISRLNK